ncbi:MAG: type II toxin-antitoxin system RelE/ParE family toxin [Candidatus Eremiobacteraeota bacterium]|nr:type II toxin-antitoxin system RelE/ParE family toxin [Candidatus Eremiobacteraeota bacterium]
MNVILTGPAQKDINALAPLVKKRVQKELVNIASGNARLEKLAEPPPRWKVRVGEYRIVLTLDASRATATILKVKHRREVYR